MAHKLAVSRPSAAQQPFLAAQAHRPGPRPLRNTAPDSHISDAIAQSHVPASALYAEPGNKSVSFDSRPGRHDNATGDMVWSTRSERRRGRSPGVDGAATQTDAAERYADERTRILSSGRGRIGDYSATRTTAANGEDVAATGGHGPSGPGKGTGSVGGAAAHGTKIGKNWWTQMLDNFGSVELENKGSVARDHLALGMFFRAFIFSAPAPDAWKTIQRPTVAHAYEQSADAKVPERTFLAWLRTSLSFASIGIAITQLFRLNTTIAKDGESPDATKNLRQVGKPLGSTFIAISVVVLFMGFHRYFESQHYVIRGKFPASRGSVIVIASSAGALIVASLIVVLAIGKNDFEV